jgi:hypothetical protein
MIAWPEEGSSVAALGDYGNREARLPGTSEKCRERRAGAFSEAYHDGWCEKRGEICDVSEVPKNA